MAICDLFLEQFPSMQDLENNNWVILDSLGNIYEIFTNLTMMALFDPALQMRTG